MRGLHICLEEQHDACEKDVYVVVFTRQLQRAARREARDSTDAARLRGCSFTRMIGLNDYGSSIKYK